MWRLNKRIDLFHFQTKQCDELHKQIQKSKDTKNRFETEKVRLLKLQRISICFFFYTNSSTASNME